MDAAGNALVTGGFNGPARFATSPTATTLTSASGKGDMFVAKFGAGDGAAAWVVRAGGSGNDESTDVTANAAGNVLVTGSFTSTASFGSQTLTGAGTTAFLAMLGGAGALATAAGQAAAPATLYPNPAHGSARLTGAAPYAPLTLRDALGRTVLTATADASGAAVLDVGGLPAGLYLLREAGGATRRLAVE